METVKSIDQLLSNIALLAIENKDKERAVTILEYLQCVNRQAFFPILGMSLVDLLENDYDTALNRIRPFWDSNEDVGFVYAFSSFISLLANRREDVKRFSAKAITSSEPAAVLLAEAMVKELSHNESKYYGN